MDARSKYQRMFLIFNPEDAGYGVGQDPSGYVKVEVNEGKGKLLASVQNLNENRGLTYKLYWIKSSGDSFNAVCAGELPLQKNRGELKLEFNPANVENSSIPFQDFNVMAVIGEDKNVDNMLVLCPLAAYKNGKVQWREKFRGIDRLSKNTKAPAKPEAVQVETIPSPVQNPVSQEKENIDEEDKSSKSEHSPENNYIIPEPEVPVAPLEETTLEKNIGIESGSVDESAPFQKESVIPKEETGVQSIPEQPLPVPNAVPSDFDDYQKMLKTLDMEEKANKEEPPAGDCGNNTGFCMPLQNVGENNPCENCQSNNPVKEQPSRNQRREGDVDSLRVNLDKYFETYDPFRSRRRDYRWWKVGSPVQLNNILYQCEIKTPLLFNPALMMAHFKYRHLIVGIYSDRARRREYIVCGVPGVYNVDERPFGSFCRWAQVEGNRPRHGAFGYWLIYIDTKTGKFLSVN